VVVVVVVVKSIGDRFEDVYDYDDDDDGFDDYKDGDDDDDVDGVERITVVNGMILYCKDFFSSRHLSLGPRGRWKILETRSSSGRDGVSAGGGDEGSLDPLDSGAAFFLDVQRRRLPLSLGPSTRHHSSLPSPDDPDCRIDVWSGCG